MLAGEHSQPQNFSNNGDGTSTEPFTAGMPKQNKLKGSEEDQISLHLILLLERMRKSNQDYLDFIMYMESLGDRLGVENPETDDKDAAPLSRQEIVDLRMGLHQLYRDDPQAIPIGSSRADIDKAFTRFKTDLYTPSQEGPSISRSASMKAALQDAGIVPGDGKWHLVVQKTGDSRVPGSHKMATGELHLIDPSGKVAFVSVFRSGGWGKHGDSSELPGLSNDLTSAKDGINASYELNWKLRDSGYKFDHKGYKDRNFMDFNEGAAEMKADGRGRSGFALHTEYSRGSLGCVVIPKEQVQALFDKLDAIPREKRPENLVVLQSQQQIAQRHPDLVENPTQLATKKQSNKALGV